MTVLTRVKESSFWGLILGLLFGHVDIASRIIALNIEWFEVYQCLLLPVVLCAPCFSLIGLSTTLSTRFSRAPQKARACSPFCTLSLLFFLLFIFVCTVQLVVYGEVVLWDATRSDTNGWALLGFIIILLLILAKQQSLADQIAGHIERVIKSSAASHYLFSLSVFCVVSLGLDLYLLKSMPSPPVPAPNAISRKPNVILITLDTLRADYMSLHGASKQTTPNIDALAGQGVVFERAYSTSNWTLPAHASLFTGNFCFRHDATEIHQKIEEDNLTLAEILKSSGYYTAGFIGGPYLKSKFGFGQGFDYYHDRLDFLESRFTDSRLSIVRMLLSFVPRKQRLALLQNDEERTAEEINSDLFNWLEMSANSQFFLFINYFDVHDPYTLGAEFRGQFDADAVDDELLNQFILNLHLDPQAKLNHQEIDAQTRANIIAMHQAEIFYLDRELGRLFEKLRTLKLLENTVIILTSDHGEEFFDHGGVLHKVTLYEEMLWVPLIFYYPRELSAKRVAAQVGIIDVVPTVLDLLQLTPVPGIDGSSLMPLLRGETTRHARGYMLAEREANPKYKESDLKALIKYPQKYVLVRPELPRVPEAVYNLALDPYEKKNLIKTEPEIAAELQRQLRALLR